MMPLASKLLHPDASGKNRWQYPQFFQNISQMEWRWRSCCSGTLTYLKKHMWAMNLRLELHSRSRTVSHSDRFQGQQLEGSSQTSLMLWLLRKSMTGRTRESFDRYKTVRSWRCSKNGKLCNSRALDLYTPASTTPYASGTLIYASAIPAARNSESLSELDIVAKQQRFRSARESDILQKTERKSESGKLTCHHGCVSTNRRHVLLLPMRIKEVGRDVRGMDKRRDGGCIVQTLPRQAAFRRLLARGENVGKTQGVPHSHPSPSVGRHYAIPPAIYLTEAFTAGIDTEEAMSEGSRRKWICSSSQSIGCLLSSVFDDWEFTACAYLLKDLYNKKKEEWIFSRRIGVFIVRSLTDVKHRQKTLSF